MHESAAGALRLDRPQDRARVIHADERSHAAGSGLGVEFDGRDACAERVRGSGGELRDLGDLTEIEPAERPRWRARHVETAGLEYDVFLRSFEE